MTTAQRAPRRMDDELTGSRWTSRPALGVAVRAAIFFGPVLAGVLASTLLVRLLVPPTGTAWVIAWWAGLFAVSGGVVFGTDRLFRRLTPLATLFSLTLVFPDQAPSRFKVVRRSNDVAKLTETKHRWRGKQEAGEASETIVALIAALDAHDSNTRGHSERTGVYSDMLAREMNVPTAGRDRLRWAALLHDVGKLAVSADTLTDTGTPKEEGWDEIRRHPEEGARLAAPLMPWLGEWGRAIAEHHERFDGAGYPNGLYGEDISLAGRIVAVADAYDTMTAGRPYRKPLSPEAARAEIADGAGTRYDPRVCRAMMQLSLGRPRRSIAVLGWLGQLPFTLGFDRFGHGLVAAAQTAGSVAAAGVGTVALLVSGVVTPAKATEPSPAPSPIVEAVPEGSSAPEAATVDGPAPTEAPPAATSAPGVPASNDLPPVDPAVPDLPVPVPSTPVVPIVPVAPTSCSASTQTLAATNDAWVTSYLADVNHGVEDTLYVQSKDSDNKPADAGHNDRRALLAFAPKAPSGCRVVSATLRLFSIHAHEGRTIDVLRASSLWSETGVLWANQPAASGSAVSAPSGLGWRTWNVTSLMGDGSARFVVKDRVEGDKGTDQRYVSREGTENVPQLVVTWGSK